MAARMKKTLLSLLAVLALSVTGYSQTNLPPVGGNTNFWSDIWTTLTTGTNYIVAPHYLYSVDKHTSGCGFALLARLSDTVLTGVGLDYLGDGDVWMPSATVQLNAPKLALGKIETVFFGYTGIATPLNSNDENWTAVAIAGTGANFRIWKNVRIFGAYEYRTGGFGQFVRAGVDIKF